MRVERLARPPDTGGRTATSACSAPTLARNASKSSAAATSIQSSSVRASATASAACPVENALLTRSATGFAGLELELAAARRGRGRRSARDPPDRRVPSERTSGASPALSASTTRSRDLGPHALVPGREAVGQPEQRGPHDVIGGRLAEPDEVAGDRRAVERARVRRVRPSRRDACRRRSSRRTSASPSRSGALDDRAASRACASRRLARSRRVSPPRATRTTSSSVRARAGELDRHERTLRRLGSGRPCPGTASVVDLGRAARRGGLASLPGHEAADEIGRPARSRAPAASRRRGSIE